MAKAKKSDDSKPADKKPAAEKTAAEKKPAKKPAAKKSAAPSAPTGFPMIDTGAAAAAAASLIRHKVSTDNLGGTGKKSSAGFQQMKDSLNKSPSSIVGGMLGAVQDKKNQQGHSGQAKQVGHNQTFGADVNRTGVPRRTGGG
jgi:hypothetical protein